MSSSDAPLPDDDPRMPPAVTFASGAELLMQLGIVESITREGVRHIADTDPLWPFGKGRAYPYWPLANAKVMATQPFLKFFRERKRRPKTT
ncbi:hypothetical protein [Streptomyces sp. NPDC056169]|uniref:hypothetical protein n=1 Tax=Streptomyces sp. NPDC056169 TaxID=3345734 RepID=UPI0035D994BF